jgi:hypothetical protein
VTARAQVIVPGFKKFVSELPGYPLREPKRIIEAGKFALSVRVAKKGNRGKRQLFSRSIV